MIRHQTDIARLRAKAKLRATEQIHGKGHPMLPKTLRAIGRVHLVLLALALALVFCEPTAKRFGDRLQIALPVLAWGCAAMNGSALEYAGRFFAMSAITHTSKAALGDAAINRRPSGDGKGFPSAHTSAAAFGASSLVHDCVAAHPVAKAALVMAAAFVGGSRIEAGRHDIWQVLAGAVLGWAADRVLRGQAARRAVLHALRAAFSRLPVILRAPVISRVLISPAVWWPSSTGVRQKRQTIWQRRVAPAATSARHGENPDSQGHIPPKFAPYQADRTTG